MPEAGAHERRRLVAALACAAAIAALWAEQPRGIAQPADARARRADRPALSLRGCPAEWNDALQRLLRIELGVGLPDAPGTVDVAVHCEGELADIQVATGDDRTERRMDLGTTAPNLRARVLALAIAGLARELALIAHPHEPEGTGDEAAAGQRAPERPPPPAPGRAPAPRPAAADNDAGPAARGGPGDGAPARQVLDSGRPAPDAADAAASARDRTASIQVDVLAIAGNFAASGDVLWSGGARVHYLGQAPLRAALDVQAGAYARDTRIGQVRLLAGSLGARLGLTHGRALALTAGGGLRLGIARASAAASDPGARDGTVTGAWSAPLAFLALEAALGERVRAGIDGELGAVLLPVRGRVERGDDIAVDGLWAALALALGARF